MNPAIFVWRYGLHLFEGACENIGVVIAQGFSDGLAGEGGSYQQFFCTVDFLSCYIVHEGNSEMFFKVLGEIILVHTDSIRQQGQMNIRQMAVYKVQQSLFGRTDGRIVL